jgi:hypothetical protein
MPRKSLDPRHDVPEQGLCQVAFGELQGEVPGMPDEASNAIKFTPEGGRIEVGAVPRGGTEGVEMKCLSSQHESPRRHKLTRSGAHTSLLAHTSAFA